MASAEEIKAQINSLQSQKDAIDEKIKLIKDMLEGLEKQYDIYTKRAEDVEELFEIYKSISEDNDAVSSGYYYSYFIEKLTDERRNYLDILFDFSDYAGDLNLEIERANNLYSDWKKESNSLRTKILELEAEYLLATIMEL